MNIEELEEVISSYKITKPKYKGTKVENQSLPFMLSTFRRLIKDDIPPTQDEFIREFTKENKDIKTTGIVSRLKRAYLSYVREYHLGFLLRKHFKKVVYDEKLDIYGVDYVVYYKKYRFNLHAYVNTVNGRYWRQIKNTRHNFRGTHVDLAIDLDNSKRVGKFILYDDSHMERLKASMDHIITQKKKARKSAMKKKKQS